jgi:hypothetical protein
MLLHNDNSIRPFVGGVSREGRAPRQGCVEDVVEPRQSLSEPIAPGRSLRIWIRVLVSIEQPGPTHTMETAPP